MFDKTACNDLVYGVVFPTPAKNSKGILVCTTTHGNTFIGPNANDMEDKEDTSVTAGGMDQIIASARKLIPNWALPLRNLPVCVLFLIPVILLSAHQKLKACLMPQACSLPV